MEPVESIILVDVPEGRGELEEEILRGMGHSVIVCHGPAHKSLCPILKKGGGCDLVTAAHGIVFELDLDRPQHRAILRRYQEVVREDVPIGVLVRSGQDERFADLLAGVDVWTRHPTTSDLDAFSARVEAGERVSADDESSGAAAI